MPIQRSLSDQNHLSKAKHHRPQWSRNRTMHGKRISNINSNPLQEKPPIPVSNVTKNKLSNFQFSCQINTEQKKTKIAPRSVDEKENGDVLSEDRPKDYDEDTHKELNSHSHSTNSTRLPKKKPSTPSSKLALPDLIGMGDVRRIRKDVTPEDRIEWDHNKGECNEISPTFGAVRSVKKRARSSSPVESPPISATIQFDPGSELWGRYSFSSSKFTTSQDPSISSLAHIMQTSSPKLAQRRTTPRSVAELRRANSCGNHFPKRKKFGITDDDETITKSPGVIGLSKLSVLIERVQEGLTKPKQLQTNSIDFSSKLKSAEIIETEEQTLQKFEDNQGLDYSSKDKMQAPLVMLHSPVAPNQSLDRSEISDYGEFDDDELNDVSLFTAQRSNPAVPILQAPPSDSMSVKPSTSSSDHRHQPTSIKSSPSLNKTDLQKCSLMISKDVTNNFDDSEDEILSADLEVLLSQYDTRSRKDKNSMLSNISAKPLECFETKTYFDDEFDDGGLDDDDFKAVEASTLETTNSHLTPIQKVRAIQRYLVVDILNSTYQGPGGHTKIEKILSLHIETEKFRRFVHLRGIWIDTPVTLKAYVHVIGPFNSNGHCVVDDNNNLLILHPDHLISSTVVADSFSCIRRAVLQDRVKATSEPNASLVYGTILHEIFQSAMLSNRWDSVWLAELIENIATRHVEDFYSIKIPIPDAIRYLRSKMAEMQSWAKHFVSPQPKPEAVVKALNGETVNLSIDKLLDVEEHIWSPMYGLKGNIDATVQVTIREEKQKQTLTVPFEVKTGKNKNASHRAQTALYCLLLSDRYDVDVAHGILYYMETSEVNRIPAIRHELRHMIMQRNELACYVRERSSQLPAMLKKENMCNRCYAKAPCFIYHKLADDGTGETSGLRMKFDELVRHLTPAHKEFFLKWDDLLTQEEKEYMKFRRELWTMLSSEREKLGRCFSNVIIEPGSSHEDHGISKVTRYHYIMIKPERKPGFSFLDSQITVGEPIVISDENGHFALANGYATRVWKHRIAVQVDRRLLNARIRQPGFDEANNQVFTSIVDFAQDGNPNETVQKLTSPPIHYRLDKDEFSNGMATIRNNLIQIMTEGLFGSRRIRSLVVDLHEPRFKTQSTSYELKDCANINIDQRRAIEKVMIAEDYALVLGMPGTGKTTTIAYMIRALVSQGKSVLLTSYTHTAVDNILLKLKDDGIPILRLGQPSKISVEVLEFVVLGAKTKLSFEEIKNDWHETPIVATTCLGINHAVFNERTFDYCIVDEASQITLPVCLGPICLANTFILVGDHFQLPPLVQNENARKGGLDISLFRLLSENHPASVVYLEHQYRMCEDIMTLSNRLIYNGRLKCGSLAVSRRKISIPNMDNLQNFHFSPSNFSCSQNNFCLGAAGNKCWLYDILDPANKVSFLNTDPLLPLSREEEKGNRIVNPTEAKLCSQLVYALLGVGVPASSIGVMTHYRSQLALLKHYLQAHSLIEMHTADRFQGRDKEVIILSLVRSNDNKSIGELLKDWRRINVAFTRAKAKLLIIGSRETLKGNGLSTNDKEEEMVARFVKLMEEKNWIYELPSSALEDHLFPDGWTQVTASSDELFGGPDPAKDEASKLKINLEFAASNLDLNTDDDDDDDNDNDNDNKKPKPFKDMNENELMSGESKQLKRQPRKRNFGNKPFKMPQAGLFSDVINEVRG